MPLARTKTTRNVNLILTKTLGLEWTMNGLGKPFREKSDPKKSTKQLKIKMKLLHVNKKTTS